MGLRIFSVTGEALNFGGRRMETIMRVAWLPVVLLLILNMATVFAYLSVIAGQVITFTDIPSASFARAQQILAQNVEKGFQQSPQAMWTITLGNLALQTLLIASFMAPLIRYAGLGEKPARGALRLAFGPDQLRYIFAGLFSFLFVFVLILGPILAASYYILEYIMDALSQTIATFPDPDSLHTIELTTVGQSMAARGASWVYNLAIPMAAVAPFALIFWGIIFFHFHPRNRPAAALEGNPILRALTTLVVAAAILVGGYWLLQNQIAAAFVAASQASSSIGAEQVSALAASPANAILFVGLVLYLIVGYYNLRLYPYPGVAVCRKSLLPGKTFKVSRGWDLIRLQLVLFFVGLFLILVQFFINKFALNWILQAISTLYQASASSSRLLSSGVTADWILPFWVWTWNIVKIIINVFWAFFSYGVAAGLYGRLYRESERVDNTRRKEAAEPEVWRRNEAEPVEA